MFTKKFWKAAGERALKTFCQTAVVTIGAGPVTGVLDLDWAAVGSISALSAVVSLLTSVGSSAINEDGSPSLSDVEHF